jgi:hypothetical protein
MRVELDVPESVTEPRMWVKHQPVLAMALRRGSVEMGLRRSEMKRHTYDAGEMNLIPRHLEKWFRNEDLHGLCIGISDAALAEASDEDPKYRGTGGPMFVQPLLPTSPMGRAMFEGALSLGIPTFENRNDRMMEGDGGCSLVERGIRDGRRLSVFRSYTVTSSSSETRTVKGAATRISRSLAASSRACEITSSTILAFMAQPQPRTTLCHFVVNCS